MDEIDCFRVLVLWDSGHDTATIAETGGVAESTVYNFLIEALA